MAYKNEKELIVASDGRTTNGYGLILNNEPKICYVDIPNKFNKKHTILIGSCGAITTE